MEKHEFDPGPTGIETRCAARVRRDFTPHSIECGLPLVSSYHFQPEEDCVGCLTGYDIGLPSSSVAYAHPECPVHGRVPAVLPDQHEHDMAGCLDCTCSWTPMSSKTSTCTCYN